VRRAMGTANLAPRGPCVNRLARVRTWDNAFVTERVRAPRMIAAPEVR
jgi:hypothetical protein